MSLTINEDNTEQWGEEFQAALLRGLESVGLVAEGYAKGFCPVNTGRLRNSVTHAIDNDEKAAYIGTNVEYGPYVELGTSRQKAQPFLTPAAENYGDVYRGIIEDALKGE